MPLAGYTLAGAVDTYVRCNTHNACIFHKSKYKEDMYALAGGPRRVLSSEDGPTRQFCRVGLTCAKAAWCEKNWCSWNGRVLFRCQKAATRPGTVRSMVGDVMMVAVGFNPRVRGVSSPARRVATTDVSSGVADHAAHGARTHNDARRRFPWVETHGYHRRSLRDQDDQSPPYCFLAASWDKFAV